MATGDRTLLTGRLGALAEDKIVLRMADRTDFALAGLHARAIPRNMPNGRGFRMPDGDLLQVAVLSAETQGQPENRALRELAARCAPGSARPFRVDPLPLAISQAQALQLPAPADGILVGVGGDELGQIRVDTPDLLVIGPPGSGRSTALGIQAGSLAAAGTPLVLITPRQSTLAGRLDPAAVLAHLTATDAQAVEALTAALAGAGQAAIVIDDAELLTDTPLGNDLVSRHRGSRDSGQHMLAAASSDSASGLRGLIPALAKGKCGLILQPASPGDGMPLGIRLPASVLAPGVMLRGAMIHNGRVVAVQVPALGEGLASGSWQGYGGAGVGGEGKRGEAAG